MEDCRPFLSPKLNLVSHDQHDLHFRVHGDVERPIQTVGGAYLECRWTFLAAHSARLRTDRLVLKDKDHLQRIVLSSRAFIGCNYDDEIDGQLSLRSGV